MFLILIVSGLQQTFTLKFSERQRTHLLEKFLSSEFTGLNYIP